MRNLPRNPSDQQKKIIEHATALWGVLDRHATNVALFIMGRHRGLDITEEVKEDAWLVKQNMREGFLD